MAITEYHSFTKVNCVDQSKKLVMPSGCMNLKLVFYSNTEVKNLTEDIRKFVFNNVLTEFEYIVEVDRGHNKFELLNKIYNFKLFEKTFMEGTDFFGTLLEKKRTEKKDNSREILFFHGIRTHEHVFDQLNLFSNYCKRIFVVLDKNSTKLFVKKTYSEKDEDELRLKFQDKKFKFYDMTEYLNSTDLKDSDCEVVEIQ